MEYFLYAVGGYLLGSIMFAKLWGYAIAKKDITENTIDNNPGTFNAFKNGGILCGICTVICDLGKGCLPVFLCLHFLYSEAPNSYGLAFVILAPVVGHVLPLFNNFKGGKGIATSFGSLMGFIPEYGLKGFQPVLLLAIVFIFFSLVIVISPDFYKTIATFLTAALLSLIVPMTDAVVISYFCLAALICLRLHKSDEIRSTLNISIFKKEIFSKEWTH